MMAFCRPSQAMKNHNRACGGTVGINKAALGYQTAPNVHFSPCYSLGPLWLFLSTTEQTTRLPESYGP